MNPCKAWIRFMWINKEWNQIARCELDLDHTGKHKASITLRGMLYELEWNQ